MTNSPSTEPEFAIDVSEDLSLRDLIERTPPVEPGLPCRDLIGTFLQHQSDSLVVTDGEIPIGMVTHRKVADALATQFGYALYEHRPVTELMMTNFLTVEIDTSVFNSFAPALRRSKETLYNDIIVVEEGKYRGLLSVARLMVEQARKIRAQVDQLHTARMVIEGVNSKLNQSVSDLRQTEAQLFQAEKMASVGTLAAGIAHDFNNMLGTVVAAAHMIRSSLAPETPALRYCEHIEKAASRAADLTRQMLQFSQKNIVHLQPVAINDIVDEAMKILSRTIGKNIEIRLELSPSLPPIVADETQIQQVIMNLALNARDAMTNGGALTLTTEAAYYEEEQSKRARLGAAGDYVVLRVADTGCGISAENIPKIFDPFFTTKSVGKGTGLGLSVVYGIISRHKGIIDVTSDIGKGTCFTMVFPCAGANEGIPAKTQNTGSLVHGYGTILVCDDEDALLHMMGECLASLGYRTILVAGGQEADAMFKERWKEIDLVLLDMAMPGIDGLETLRLLKKTNPDVRILIVTGYSNEERLKMAMSEGARDIIKKPVDIANLSAHVQAALADKDSSRSLSP